MGGGSYEHFIPAATSLWPAPNFHLLYALPAGNEPGDPTGHLRIPDPVARLLGLEVANASLYDGATALAEGLLMAIRVSRRKTVAVSPLVHPLYRRVVRTYFEPTGYQVVELPYLENGRTDLSPIADIDDLAAVAIQSPNFFGCIEDLQPPTRPMRGRS